MPESIDPRYDELQETLRTLRRENELLADRSKEVFLLSLVSEAIGATSSSTDILNRSLERISILKDICFAAFTVVSPDRSPIVRSWSHFGSSPDDALFLPSGVYATLADGPLILRYEEFVAHGGVLEIAYRQMKPASLLLIPCTTIEFGPGVFLFADARRSVSELSALRFLFARIVEMTAARLDTIAFVKERELADKSLEAKIEERTREHAESVEKYRYLLDTAPDAFFLIEVEGQDAGRILQANLAASEMHGYLPGEMIGMNLFDIEIVDPSVSVQEQMDRLFTGRTISIETVRKRKSGTHFTVESVRKSVDVRGRLYVISFDRDITGRRRDHESMQQAQKLESLGILAGGIAHDFNNILQGIVGYTSLMLLKSTTDPSVKQNVEAIASAADRASQITKQLLAYAGTARYQMRPIDLNAMIRENHQLLKMRLPKSVKFVTNFHDPLPKISADYVQLQEAVMNCVTNAAEAIGDAAGTVAIETAVREMTPDLISRWRWLSGELPPATYVLLSVSDTGCGIDEQTLGRIFDPFFTTKFTGRGLGLAAVLGIVRGHQGGIAVESKVGKGTRFLFALPVIPEPVEAVPEAAPDRSAVEPEHAAERKTAGKILVIDDEKTVRELISDILESVSLDVTQATDGLDGIAAYVREQHEIDLVMLDLSMPGMSGDKVFQKLREINPDVKVILSSGYAEDDVQKRYSMVRVNGYLQKPFTTRSLITKIQSCLQEQ